MRALVDQLALIVAAALVSAAVCLFLTRQPKAASPVLLDLLTAAGLLRLAIDADYRRVAAAAAIVRLGHLIGLGLYVDTGR
jgi:hypothetical protein